MTALTDWLDGLESFAPAKNQRTTRRLGGSSGSTPDRPRLIVIHTMETPEDVGRARSTAKWVQTSGGTSLVSCHFTADDVEIIRCVLDEHVAFTQLTPWNDMSLSIEQAGRAAQSAEDWHDPYSLGQRRNVAKVVAAWCQKWAIPPVFLSAGELVDWRNCTGVTTHYQISLASQRPELLALGYKAGNHTDPGPNYPMDMLLAEVRAHLALTPTIPVDHSPPMVEDTMPKRVTFGGQAAIFIGDYNPTSNLVTTVRWLSPAQNEFYATTGDVIDLPWDHVQHVACLGPVPGFGKWPFARVVNEGSTDLDVVAADMARRLGNG